MSEDSVTILKYKLDDKYYFKVMDKFDNIHEEDRLEEMMAFSIHQRARYPHRYKQLWIKTCPIFKI